MVNRFEKKTSQKQHVNRIIVLKVQKRMNVKEFTYPAEIKLTDTDLQIAL